MLAARLRAAQDATALYSNVVGSNSFSSSSSSSSSSWQRLSTKWAVSLAALLEASHGVLQFCFSQW